MEEKISQFVADNIITVRIYMEEMLKSSLLILLMSAAAYVLWNWALPFELPQLSFLQACAGVFGVRVVFGPPLVLIYTPLDEEERAFLRRADAESGKHLRVVCDD